MRPSCIWVGIALSYTALLAGCVSFAPAEQSSVAQDQRPYIAILRFGVAAPIKKLSSIKTLDAPAQPEDEPRLLEEAISQVQQEARWLLVSRIATGQGFWIVPLNDTDALANELNLQPGELPTSEQLSVFREQLGADLVVAGSILDYGKVRWQWLAGGMLADMTWETVVIGLATAWNPAIILGNVGFELLTSTPLWFGGGYLFGVAFRPVRVQARAYDTKMGIPLWQDMEESIYSQVALKQVPEDIRDKKEIQLQFNLAEIMESLGDSLTEMRFEASQLRTAAVHGEACRQNYGQWRALARPPL